MSKDEVIIELKALIEVHKDTSALKSMIIDDLLKKEKKQADLIKSLDSELKTMYKTFDPETLKVIVEIEDKEKRLKLFQSILSFGIENLKSNTAP